LSAGGYAMLGYDAAHARFAMAGSDRFGILDAATLAQLPDSPVLRPNNTGGGFLFLDADRIVLSSISGPLSLWDLTGTSVLMTRAPEPFTFGVIIPTTDPKLFFGVSPARLVMLGPGYRPLSAPLVFSGAVCRNPRTHRIATVDLRTGDVVIRGGAPPFRVVSRAPGVALSVADPAVCSWRPDGRQIAIGTYPQVRATKPTSVALYDVATHTLRSLPLKRQIVVSSLVYSGDSKTLLAGGGTTGANGVYEVTNLDEQLRVRVAFAGATGFDTDAARRRLIVTTKDSIRVFDARTRRALTPSIALPGAYIYGVASTPDGHKAAVENVQGWRLVDLDAQQPSGPLLPDGALTLAAFGSDGTTVYTTAPDGTGVTWNVGSAHVRAVACDLAGRNLTAPEWRHYLRWAGTRRATCARYPLK
jgi:hypothetical protein